MVQGGSKLNKNKHKNGTTTNVRSTKVMKRGQRAGEKTSKFSKARKLVRGVYTSGLENQLVNKMNPSQREKLKFVNTTPKAKPLTKEERKAKARASRRLKKKVCFLPSYFLNLNLNYNKQISGCCCCCCCRY